MYEHLGPSSQGLLYMGMGVSGGEEGARHGPSLMAGGPANAWDRVHRILEKIAAQVTRRKLVSVVVNPTTYPVG